MKIMWYARSRQILLVFFCLTLTTGCGNKVIFGLSNTGQSFQQSSSAFTNQLDILWVIDNSGSMKPLQNNMTTNFGSFITNFQTQGWDFRMAVTTSDAYKADPALNGYNASNAPMAQFRDGLGNTHTGVFVMTPQTPNLDSVFVTNATQGTGGSGDERVFSSFRTALNSSLNPGFLRSNSFFAVIILSDEDDFSSNSRVEGSFNLPKTDPNYVPDHDYSYVNLDTVQSYENYLDALTTSTGATRRYNVNSITVDSAACQKQYGSIIGQRYIQITADTNGVLGSVCDASFATSLQNIATQIAVLSTQFFLNTIPDPSTIQVFVNGAMIPNDPNNGWTYNSSANSIQFHGSGTPPQGANIQVNFIPLEINH